MEKNRSVTQSLTRPAYLMPCELKHLCFRIRLSSLSQRYSHIFPTIFTARAYARAVLGVVILSVSLSVCLSHAWIVTKLNDALQIFLYHTKGQSLCYSDIKSGWSATPPSLWNLRSKWPTPFEKRRLRPISAHNVSTVVDSEKSSITTNIKSTTGFPTSHRWSAYVTPKCPKGWLKERFFSPLSISQRLIVSSAVNLGGRPVL